MTSAEANSDSETTVVLDFVLRLAQALLASGEQTAKVELVLRRSASAYGMRRSRAVVFPTAIYISVHDGERDRVMFVEGPTQNLRLDQIADVYQIAEAAQRGQLPPHSGLEQLNVILRQRPRFGATGIVLGHMILTLGVTIVLMPTALNLAATAVLGVTVGALKVLNRGRPVFAIPLPVVAAAVVSALVFLAADWGLPVDPLHALVPPLVSFLPGAMLTLGMVELAYGDMVSGSSRLVAGFVQLVLLAFGLAAGAVLVGYRPADLVDATGQLPPSLWLDWSPWVGVIVFGVGAYLHFSAPRNSLGWMLLVLLLAFATQQLASRPFGSHGSGFFGMLVVTPLGYLIQLRFKGPPAMVTFLPCFWLLVPGALGLLSVKQMLSDRMAGLDGLITTIFVFVSIALGTLMGAALYKWITETFGWWQLQIGRVGSYFRRKEGR